MIWYELSKRKIKVPDPDKYELVCTYLTFMELAFTPNILKNLNEVQDAIREILRTEPEVILANPFNYAMAIIDKNYNCSFKIEENLIFTFLKILLNQPKDQLIHNELKDQLIDIISKRNENKTDWAKFLNKLNEPSKEISWIYKKYHSKEFDKYRFQEWFLHNINKISNKTYSAENINWYNFEFYEKIYSRYHRNLSISKKKVDKNDDIDLLNMLYVQPGTLYWTLEKSWLNIAKEAKIEKYLYQD